MKDTCFTMPWWSLPYISTNQSQLCVWSFPPKPPSPTVPPLWVVAEHRAGSLCCTAASCCLSTSRLKVHTCQCCALSSPGPLLPLLCAPGHSLCLPPFLLSKRVLQYHFYRFHIHTLIYDICFSFCDFNLYNRL